MIGADLPHCLKVAEIARLWDMQVAFLGGAAMRDANLTLIQTFFIVARDGSYSAAARKLGMSYQSAANHVRRLEQVLGERLVVSEQGAKTVILTPRGRSLYKLLLPELDTMLARLDRTLDRWRHRYPGLDVAADVAHGSYLDYLTQHSRQIRLVVVGSHNRAGIAQLTEPNGVAALTDSGSSVLIGNNRRL